MDMSLGIKPLNQLYDALNNAEKLRNFNDNNRAAAKRKNNIKTAVKSVAVAAAVPLTSASVILSGLEMENKQVTYKIPKFFEKSETLKKIGYKIDEGIYKLVDKTSSFLKKPKYQQLIEKTDAFVDNISAKIFKKENDLKYVTGGMTALGIKTLGTALLGGIAVKHILNNRKINKEYQQNNQKIEQQQFNAIEKFNSEMEKIY
jgi:hypothetical protein